MTENKKIDILMAIYNSEKYLSVDRIYNFSII